MPAPGRKKYNARGEHIEHAGKQVWIPSAIQAVRARQLIMMERVGTIGNLRFEVRVPLVVNNKKVCDYRCDHVYDVLGERGTELRTVWEEVKGFITPEYRLKKKLFEATTGNKISEIMTPGGGKKQVALLETEWQNRIPD